MDQNCKCKAKTTGKVSDASATDGEKTRNGRSEVGRIGRAAALKTGRAGLIWHAEVLVVANFLRQHLCTSFDAFVGTLCSEPCATSARSSGLENPSILILKQMTHVLSAFKNAPAPDVWSHPIPGGRGVSAKKPVTFFKKNPRGGIGVRVRVLVAGLRAVEGGGAG